MKKITKSYSFNEKIKYPELVTEHIDDKCLFLTVETTGLSSDKHRIISVTTARTDAEEIKTCVYFSENKNDELEVIETAISEIKSASRIITWNGDSFDMKFISKRLEIYAKKLEYNSSAVKVGSHEVPLYDLSKLLRPLKRLLPDESLSIYSLLDEMGLNDTSLPDGRTVTTLYKAWENTEENKYADTIIDHSVYKVTGIINLLSLLNSLQINKVKSEITALTADSNSSVTSESTDTKSSVAFYSTASNSSETFDFTDSESITAYGTTNIFVPLPLTFTLPGIHLTFKGNTFSCVFYAERGEIRIYYPDPSSYVRLKENGQLIPKEMTGALPTDTYEKVTRDTCYTLSTLPADPARAKKQLESYIRQLILM